MNIFRLSLIVLLLGLLPAISNAGIVVHGSTTAYQETGGDWLTMGTNDIDGSGGLGTDGYFFFGDFDGTQENSQPFSHNVNSAPSYVTGFASGANFASVAGEFPGYGQIDNPLLLDGTNGIAGVALGTGGTAGDSREIMTFTVAGLTSGQIVRVGVLGGTEANTNGRWDSTSFTLSDGTFSATVGNHSTSPLAANPGGTNTGWVFFDIDLDGTYAVSGTKRLNTQGAGMGGLTFDSISPVPEPTSMAVLALGGFGLLLRRRK